MTKGWGSRPILSMGENKQTSKQQTTKQNHTHQEGKRKQAAKREKTQEILGSPLWTRPMSSGDKRA